MTKAALESFQHLLDLVKEPRYCFHMIVLVCGGTECFNLLIVHQVSPLVNRAILPRPEAGVCEVVRLLRGPTARRTRHREHAPRRHFQHAHA